MLLFALAVWLFAALVAAALLHSGKCRQRAFALAFEEIMNPQEITLHVSTHYKVSGTTADLMPDGSPVILSNFAITGTSGDVGVEVDTDPTNGDEELDTAATVGATDTLTATADGSNGKKYGATAAATLAAKDVVIEPFTLVFEEIVA